MALKSLRNAPVGIGQYTPVGQMHNRITFLSQGNPDNKGNFAAPTVVAEIWASVRPASGFSRLRSDQTLQKQQWKLVFSWMDGLDESMLVMYEGVQLQIDNLLDPDGRKVELQMVCSATDVSAAQ